MKLLQSDIEYAVESGQLTWKRDGLKYLVVFLGNKSFSSKNWEEVIDKVEGRFKHWKWLLPKMSFRGPGYKQPCLIYVVAPAGLLGPSSQPSVPDTSSDGRFLLGSPTLGSSECSLSAYGGRGAGTGPAGQVLLGYSLYRGF